MTQIIAYIQTMPLGKARVIELTYKPDNVAAKRLYAGLGFVETGNIHPSGEVYAELVL